MFGRAIAAGNLVVAEVTFREMGVTTLVEALDLTALIALKAPRRRGRVCARWLRRYLEANEHSAIDELAFVANALNALGGGGHDAAYSALRDMAERASGGRRARDVA